MKIPIEKSDESEPQTDYTLVNSFEDACELLNMDPSLLPVLSAIPKRYKKPMVAFYKLMVITEAINGMWIPDFTDPAQVKFQPGFNVDPSGKKFSGIINEYFIRQPKTSLYLCLGKRKKSLYIANHFTELYRDFLLIDRDIQNFQGPGKEGQAMLWLKTKY